VSLCVLRAPLQSRKNKFIASCWVEKLKEMFCYLKNVPFIIRQEREIVLKDVKFYCALNSYRTCCPEGAGKSTTTHRVL
jgi:hypothetical protein